MTPRIKSALSHGAMAFLYALGMTLALLGVTGLLRHGWLAFWVLMLGCGACSAVSLGRKGRIVVGCIGAFVGAVWLMIGGAGMIGEVLRALTLHLSGLTTALPMVGAEFTVMVCLLTLAVAWLVTQRGAGAVPALILLALCAVLLWLTNRPDVLSCLLPAVIACVTLLFRAGDEHTSTLRVLPLAAAVTGVAFIGVWAGGAEFAPMKNLADSIRQRIYDTFFYTQPRDKFTLASEGYYPQGEGQLGGPVTPREVPVMAVITPRKAYLRGVAKNVYTGRTWVDDTGGKRYLWSASRFDDKRTSVFNLDLPRLDASADGTLLTPAKLQIRMVTDGVSTLFVPQRVRMLTPEGDLLPYFNMSSEIFATTNLRAGDVWTVEAPLFTAADAGVSALVNAADTAADPGWDAACEAYLQLPEGTIDPRVYELCAQVTAGIYRPFDRAMAIQRHLQVNYAYTLETAEQSPKHDFVSTFLIETQEGYCTYFASAMTVMARMAGLPARYVEGYVAYPDETGLAVVTGLEGHAWTEVYFRGFGWVTFDATPITADTTQLPPDMPPQGGDPDNTPEPPENTPEPDTTPEPSDDPPQDEPTPEPSPEPDQQPTPSPAPGEAPDGPEAPQTQPDDDPPNPWKTALLVLLLLAIALRIVLVQPGVQARMAQTAFRRWMVWAQATHDALRRYGLRRDMAETPSAFLLRAEKAGVVRVSLAPLAQAENLMFYGHAEPFQEEIDQAQATFASVWKGMSLWQKAVFQGKRVLMPGRFGMRNDEL